MKNKYTKRSWLVPVYAFAMLFTTSLLSWSGEILLTGGTGYIGSHVAVVLLEQGYDVVLVDNLANSDASAVDYIEKAAGKKVKAFYPYNLLNRVALEEVFANHNIDAVIHLAGFKVLSESIQKPLNYFRNNLESTITLLEVMKDAGCKKLIFSSSASVYGNPQYLPIDESHPTNAANPYAKTKLMIEEFLKDVAISDPTNQFIALRYFNPVGAHKSGLIGETPNGVPANLVPYMLEVVQGIRPHLTIHGNDFETADGTAVRDFIHIMDLAEAHAFALKSFGHDDRKSGFRVYNIGTGRGYSVKEMVDAMSASWGKPLPCVVGGRRAGDMGQVFADSSKAKKELGFEATRSLEDMMEDSLMWAKALASKRMKKEEL